MRHFAAKKESDSELRRLLPARLPEFLSKQRWFGGKARQVLSAEIADIIPMSGDRSEALLLIVKVHYAAGRDEHYAIPVLFLEQTGSAAEGQSVLLNIENDDTGTRALVVDAAKDADFLAWLFAVIEHDVVFRGRAGELRGVRGNEFARLLAASPLKGKPRLSSGEQSNTSVIYDERFILKFFRRIEEGINPELEIGAFLTEKAHFPHVPQLVGHLEYRDPQGQPITQGILQTFVPNQSDAWRHMIKSVAGFYEIVRRRGSEGGDPAAFGSGAEADRQLPEFARATLDPDLAAAALLGKRTAELHLALASGTNSAAFEPEPFTMEFQQTFGDSLRDLTNVTFNLLRARRLQLPVDLRAKADDITPREKDVNDFFGTVLSAPIHAARTRIHGDYHLGQVLYTGCDFVIIDFEGEPARPLGERRAKRSPLQDVAGMMRSFHYAAFAPLFGALENQPGTAHQLKQLAPWAEAWSGWFTTRFLNEYFDASGGAAYLPANDVQLQNLLKLHLLEKAIYELSYELNNRPTWVGIPLQGIAQLLTS